MKRQRIRSAFCLLCMACACLFVFCGCSKPQDSAGSTTAASQQETTAPEEAAATEAQQTQAAYAPQEDAAQIVQMDGVEVIYGRVERVSGSMVYTPDAGSGYFTVNGTIAEDSEIAISIHPTGVLRYNVTLDAQAEKTVKAEIRVYKKGALLVSCVNPETALQQGSNKIDVCIDTGEGEACRGTYDLQLYLDDLLVRTDTYEA